MNNSYRFFIFTIGVLFFCFGCKTPVYYPNTVNTPHFENEKEAEVVLVGSLNGIEVLGAYALKDDLAIISNFNGHESANQGDVDLTYLPFEDDYIGEYRSHYFGDIGLAKWYDFDDKGTIGCSVGYGFGNTRFNYRNNFNDVNIQRLYIQPYYGVLYKNLEFYIASRMTYVDVGYSNVFIEPTLTLKAGFNKLKVFAQLGFSNQHGNRFDHKHIPTQGVMFSFGLSYKFKKPIVD